jgi:molybdopterin-guanine dinucleotide biosynthesis protein A
VLVLSPADAPPTLPVGVEVRIARDARPGEGPLAGLAAGLAAARSPLALVVAGDMPELQTPVLAALLRIAEDRGADAVALEEGGTVVPMPCVVRVRPAADAASALLGAGRRRLRELLEALRVEGVPESVWRALDPRGRSLLDVDEPGDLPSPPPDP